MEETKLCKKCGRVLPLNHDYWNWRNKSKGEYQTMCRECRKAYLRDLYSDPDKYSVARLFPASPVLWQNNGANPQER